MNPVVPFCLRRLYWAVWRIDVMPTNPVGSSRLGARNERVVAGNWESDEALGCLHRRWRWVKITQSTVLEIKSMVYLNVDVRIGISCSAAMRWYQHEYIATGYWVDIVLEFDEGKSSLQYISIGLCAKKKTSPVELYHQQTNPLILVRIFSLFSLFHVGPCWSVVLFAILF